MQIRHTFKSLSHIAFAKWTLAECVWIMEESHKNSLEHRVAKYVLDKKFSVRTDADLQNKLKQLNLFT